MSEGFAWHEDDTFWSEMAPFMFDEASWEIIPSHVDLIEQLLEITPGMSILDMACGPGRYALELANRGYLVTGVDITEIYLEEARGRSLENGLDVEFVRSDMRHFTRPESFDAAISMFTSFGYFDRAIDNQQVLRNISNSLKTGGRFLIDLIGKEILARIFQERDWREKDGAILLEDRQVIRNWTQMHNRRTLIRGDRKIEFVVQHWLYSASELADMLEDAGFRQVDIFGDLQGIPYDDDARRLVAVAQK